ncbi:unnamed protein product [Trifolium pratense]|uniref:Uncharacterized protein n=1 Tax=Trifolium pratense TaxID=57577 RepID=A0ACB0IWD0_TRIPR|nr:unnamed protein product [Trifolium pratense]
MPLYNTKPVFLILIPLLMLHHNWNLSFEFPNFLGPYTNDILTYQGDAFASQGTIQLTKVINHTNVPNSVGRASYALPLRLTDSTNGEASFITTFSFLIESNGSNSGDGIAFFIVPYNSSIPESSGGGYLGLFNPNYATNALLNEIVAVEFDTYPNEWDPPFAHVGIDVNSIESVKTVKWGIESVESILTTVVVTVSYDVLIHKLNVVVSYHENTRDVTTISLSSEVNLKAIMTTDWASIGFSGATGLVDETHKILSWSFSSTMHYK